MVTRLYVNVRCESCGKAHGVDAAGSYIGAKDIVRGLCLACEVEKVRDERETKDLCEKRIRQSHPKR